MADGVENAAVVCCFMTPKYQNSRNCEKELLYAERRRVQIIPCRLTRDWEPSTWLGLVIAGLVWVDFRETTDANVDLKIDKLIDQIRVVAGQKLNCFFPGLISNNRITVYMVCTSFLETPSAVQTRPICFSSSSNILHSNIPIVNDNLVRSTSIDSSSGSPKRLAAMIPRQQQSIDNTNTVPPPVPPRPNKDLIQERLLHTNVKKNINEIESIDEKKENSMPLNSGKPDICEISLQQQVNARAIPVR
jgi:hypothetical protein